MIPHSKPWMTTEDFAAVNEVLSNGMIACGEKATEFKNVISSYFDNIHVTICNSGTSALLTALLSLEIGIGDEVILPTYVCHSVADAILAVGAKPVFCDIQSNWIVTVDNIIPYITKRTKAIIIVDIFGIAVNPHPFLNLNIPIIEDCCQSFGGEIFGKKLGTIGTIGFFSFHATKCLTTGEGGAVITVDERIIKKILDIQEKSIVPSNMCDLQASLGLAQMRRYPIFLKKRRAIADYYFEQLPEYLTAPIRQNLNQSIFFRFPLRFRNGEFNKIQALFAECGIYVRRGVDELLHRRYEKYCGEYPNAEKLYKETVSIPIYPSLSDSEVQLIVEKVKRISKKQV